MVRLAMILLGVDYLRMRWREVMAIGFASIALGAIVFADALDGVLFLPIRPFAFLMLLEGIATLSVAWTGMGGQRMLRLKGATFCLSALLVLIGGEHGNFALSMIFGTLFLVDDALQIVAAKVVRYRRWKIAVAGGVLEMLIAIFFYQPYLDHYAGTVAYCVAFGLFFGEWNMALLALRVRRMASNPAADTSSAPERFADAVWDSPPEPHETALTCMCVDASGIGEGGASAAADRRSLYRGGGPAWRDIDGTRGAGDARGHLHQPVSGGGDRALA